MGNIIPLNMNKCFQNNLKVDENNLFYHLDGARIWNAYVKNGIDFKEYGNLFDTISVCLSKGLGCPVGSLLLCSEKLYEKALTLDSNNKAALEYQGELFAQTNRPLLAESNLAKLKILCPDSCEELEQLDSFIKGTAEK